MSKSCDFSRFLDTTARPHGLVGGLSPPGPLAISMVCAAVSRFVRLLRTPQHRSPLTEGAVWLIHSFNGTDLLGGGGGSVGCPDSSFCPEANPTKTTYSIETSAILIIIRTPYRAGHTVK